MDAVAGSGHVREYETFHLAVRIYVMIPPRKAVEKALKAMFGRRKQLMPGLINKIFLPLIAMLPDWIIGPVYGLVKKHVKGL